jgi:hypothetical protein
MKLHVVIDIATGRHSGAVVLTMKCVTIRLPNWFVRRWLPKYYHWLPRPTGEP